MIPSITAVRLTGARRRTELPLLVLGPSLGTSATALWSQCAAGLTDAFDLLAWDLPGHGHNRSVPDEPFTMAELAEGVLRVVDDVLAERGDAGGRFFYAGDSVGGTVGLQLLLDRPDRVAAAVLLCTGARIGDEAAWTGRIAQVSMSGTPVMVAGSAERWFGPGFLDRSPDVGATLLQALRDADDEGYVQVCSALASFDVRDRLAEIAVPVLAVAGSHDVATPPDLLRAIADGVRDGSYAELDGVAHLAPAETPGTVAALLRQHFLGEGAEATDLARELQEVVAEYARGGIWTRPGLDRRSRFLVTLTALVTLRHHEELATHVRAARTHGLTAEETTEVIMQAAVHCGVPDASTALRIAQQALAEDAS